MDVTIGGAVEPGWESVADAFRINFDHGEIGAACCVYRDGVPVVDLVGGIADPETGRTWDHATLAPVFSTTKGATAVCANLLIERGELDPDAPVARYWPEFAANGKAGVLVRHVLSHTAGLPVVDGDFTLAEALAWDPVVAQLARQTPRWEPGTAVGYHLKTFGWLTGEIVRRITGRTLGRFFNDEIAGPLGLDWWIGLPEALEPRVARIVPPITPIDPEIRELMDAVMAPGTLIGDAITGPSGLFRYDDMWNTRALHACELPSSNGIASAPAVARMYAATIGRVDGTRILTADAVERATQTFSDGTDRVLGAPMRYGLGFSLYPTLNVNAGPGAFGHSGAGGSLGFADADHGIGFGYVMNQMKVGLSVDRRPANLVRAVYDCLERA
ncbi:MAG: beta-lactamase family protein [Acidimicrobiia bacterium]|nr:beta-lactamase family protein [Acidimicrobiia bacterium]